MTNDFQAASRTHSHADDGDSCFNGDGGEDHPTDSSMHALLAEHNSCMDELLSMTTEDYETKKKGGVFGGGGGGRHKDGEDVMEKFKAELQEAESVLEAKYAVMLADRDQSLLTIQTSQIEDMSEFAASYKKKTKGMHKQALDLAEDESRLHVMLAQHSEALDLLLIASAEDSEAAAEEAEKTSMTTMRHEEMIETLETELSELKKTSEQEIHDLVTAEEQARAEHQAEIRARDDHLVDLERAHLENLNNLELDHEEQMALLREEAAEDTLLQLEAAEDEAEQHYLEQEEIAQQEMELQQSESDAQHDLLAQELKQALQDLGRATRERDNVWTALEELQAFRKSEEEKDIFRLHRSGADAAAGHGENLIDFNSKTSEASRREASRGRKVASRTPWKC